MGSPYRTITKSPGALYSMPETPIKLDDVDRIGWHWHAGLERWVRAVFGRDGYVLSWYVSLRGPADPFSAWWRSH